MTDKLTLSMLLDREAIRDCIYRAAMANDMRDIETWKGAYWPDGHEDHRPLFFGNAHDFVDAIVPLLEQTMDATWHQVSGVVIKIDDKSARAISYVHTHVRMKCTQNTPAFDLHGGLRYLDRFEKRGGEWRILSRTTQPDWSRQTPIPPDIVDFGAEPTPGMRSAEDPVHLLFPEAMPNGLYIEEGM